MDLAALLPKIRLLPPAEQASILEMLGTLEVAQDKAKAQKHFLSFVYKMWPGFIHGEHHKIMAEAFDRVSQGLCKRLIINMPPRHTKSMFASYLLPAWFLGKFPDKKIIQATHTAELSVNFGRNTRNLLASEDFQKVFDGVTLQSDSKAAGRWSTNAGGEYFAVGVGGAIAGKGADLFIIDDPHTEQQAIAAAHDHSIYDKAFEWYTSGPRQRLQPDASIVIVMCMTGDTDVLLADGATAKLRDIRPGDVVATYEAGGITSARVNNWRSSGVDFIWTVTTQSGRILRANERHPFLVDIAGERRWITLRDLKPGMQLVATTAALGQPELRGALPARLANPLQPTAKNTPTPSPTQSGITVNGRGLCASSATARPFILGGSAFCATANNTRLQPDHQRHPARIEFYPGMALRARSMTAWLPRAVTAVTCAVKSRIRKIRGHTGTESSVSTIATTRRSSEGCSATTATSWLDTAEPQIDYAAPLSIYSVILDPIVDIAPAGEEEVFDVEVDRTENFIANGVVSHNTRWGKRDLTGRLLQSSTDRDGTSEWEVIELPAILPSGKPLWPEYWSLESLHALKAELPAAKWNAQYQQLPTSEDGAILKREWWRRWEHKKPPEVELVMVSVDTAYTRNTKSDYSAFTVWGVFQQADDHGVTVPNLILLDAFQDRLEFPALKARAMEVYTEWEPDVFLVEAKASGLPLIHEMRHMGILVSEFTPSRASGDKIMRANSVTDLFASGVIWAPETKWADELIETCAAFPNGDHDDLVDSTVMALMRYRQGGFIRLASDYDADYDKAPERRRHVEPYY